MKPLFDLLKRTADVPRTKEDRAATACNGIHMALTMIMAIVLVAVGVSASFPYYFFGFMFLGWIPLRIWLYPFLLKRMK
jgi:hypothetical protein